ncbi:hypothetical protein C0J52_17879 [Blattella germanica]|nr:hypothetical protein C0J52_17879 [Blattella germanica]
MRKFLKSCENMRVYHYVSRHSEVALESSNDEIDKTWKDLSTTVHFYEQCLIMAGVFSKGTKRKREDEGRVFQDTWEHDYFFIPAKKEDSAIEVVAGIGYQDGKYRETDAKENPDHWQQQATYSCKFYKSSTCAPLVTLRMSSQYCISGTILDVPQNQIIQGDSIKGAQFPGDGSNLANLYPREMPIQKVLNICRPMKGLLEHYGENELVKHVISTSNSNSDSIAKGSHSKENINRNVTHLAYLIQFPLYMNGFHLVGEEEVDLPTHGYTVQWKQWQAKEYKKRCGQIERVGRRRSDIEH